MTIVESERDIPAEKFQRAIAQCERANSSMASMDKETVTCENGAAMKIYTKD